MYTAKPKPLAAPARSTTPSPAAYSGVRIGAARSIPQWKVPQREQKQLVYRAPWIGSTNLGRAASRAAASASARAARDAATSCSRACASATVMDACGFISTLSSPVKSASCAVSTEFESAEADGVPWKPRNAAPRPPARRAERRRAGRRRTGPDGRRRRAADRDDSRGGGRDGGRTRESRGGRPRRGPHGPHQGGRGIRAELCHDTRLSSVKDRSAGFGCPS